MSYPCEHVRLYVLAIAAAIQYVGASAKRQFLYLVKLLVIVLPGMKDRLDKLLTAPKDSGRKIYQNGLHLISRIVNTILPNLPPHPTNNDIDTTIASVSEDNQSHLFEFITDLFVDLLLWFLTFFVSILALLGVLIESATGLIAGLLRLICSNSVPTSFSRDRFRNGFNDFITNVQSTTTELNELNDSNIRWKIVSINSNRENTDYDCSSTKENNKASSFSFAAQATDDNGNPKNDFNYIDSGVRYDFLLVDGILKYGRRPSGIEGLRFVNTPNIVTYPKRFPSTDLTAETGLSFHKFRLGQKIHNLRFDMIAASNDRVFVKVEKTSDFYFAIMDELFWNNNAPIPSIYFKLDPEFGATNTTDGSPISPSSLVQQISGDDFPNHPQAERLPMFHKAVGMGILDAMVISVKPKTWYRLDTRPPHYGNEISSFDNNTLPSNFPTLMRQYKTRPASLYKGTYLSGGTVIEKGKNEFKFTKVLSLGVGNFHYYESWIEDYGGEIQPLHQSGPFNLSINMSLYGLFNGPLWDGDGACDGTCNFYILVKLDHGKNHTKPDDKYGILWCDEQTYFTKRWRLLDPRDNEPWKIDIPHDINLSLTAALRRDKESGLLNQQYNFDYEKYWMSDPFQQGLINGESRMAVARQIVLVTGNKGNRPTLFSINFSYGSIDRRWRSRNYPNGVTVSDDLPSVTNIPTDSTIFPKTVHIREDMTLTLKGYYKDYGMGRWFQRYLPCSRQHPEKNESYEYTHSWRFLPEKAFQRADAFSHFGVYDQVDSRNQYYVVELVESQSSFDCPIKLQDFQNLLSIRGIKFNWGLFKNIDELENFLEDNGADSLPKRIRKGTELEALSEKLLFRWDQMGNPDVQYRKSRTSAHHKNATFRLLNRGPMGYILVWDDKRDDDLISLSNLPQVVAMECISCLGSKITLRIVRNIRVTSLPNVLNVSLFLSGNKLKITIETEQNQVDAIANLWAIRIAALPEGGNPDLVMIYEAENLFRHEKFTTTYSAESNKLTLSGIVEVDASYEQYLSTRSALKHSTSAWFEDIVGHVSTPDLIKF